MRPILLAVFAAALPLTAHAETLVFSGPAINFSNAPDYSGALIYNATGTVYAELLVPYGVLTNYPSTGGSLCTTSTQCHGQVSGVVFSDDTGPDFVTGSLTGGTLVAGTTATYQYTLLNGVLGDATTPGEDAGADGPITGTVDIDTAGGQFVSADLTFTYTPATSTPASVTPEPSSLILLGTGALSLAGAARRRFLRS